MGLSLLQALPRHSGIFPPPQLWEPQGACLQATCDFTPSYEYLPKGTHFFRFGRVHTGNFHSIQALLATVGKRLCLVAPGYLVCPVWINKV